MRFTFNWMLAGVIVFVSTNASALSDCRKFSAIGQLEERLNCLEDNNIELSKQLAELKNGALSYNSVVWLAQGNACLTNGPNQRTCGSSENSPNFSWTLRSPN